MKASTPWTLITGGAKGLGAAIALHLASKGHHILVHYRHSELDAHQVAAACRQQGVQADIVYGDFSSLLSTEQFTRNLQQFSHIKYLVQNVGEYLVKSISETTIQEWEAVFQTNLNAPFVISKALLPTLIERQGSMVNIGIAGAGNLVADVYASAYRIAKSGLLMLTKSLAKELAPANVSVNMVSPGYMDNAIDLPEVLSALPMRRAATLREVADVVAFLLADQNKYITGQNIEVSGGVRL